MNKNSKGIIYTLLAAAGFGLAAPLSKIIYSFGISTYVMLTYRFLMAGLLIMIYMLIKKKYSLFRVKKNELKTLFLLGGVVYVLTTTLYFNAIKFMPVSIHVIIFYTYPMMINLFSVVVLKEALPVKQGLAMIISFVGLFLMAFSGSGNIIPIGLFFSVGSALCYGSYLMLLNQKHLHNLSSLTLAFYTNVFSGCSFLILSLITGEMAFQLPMEGLLGISIMAVFSTVLAIIVLKQGIQLIGPSKASIISTFEPLEGVILSVLFLDEALMIRQFIGIGLVIYGILLIRRVKKVPVVLSYKKKT